MGYRLTTKREILSIDSGLGTGLGRFGPLHDYCRKLHFHVTSTADLDFALKFLEASDPFAAVLVDGNVLTPEESDKLINTVRSISEHTPICWQRSSSGIGKSYLPNLPDRSLEFEGNATSDLQILDQAIKRCFFPRIIAYAMEFSTRLSLKQTYRIDITQQESYLRCDHKPLAEVSSMISFFGDETVGSVVVSASRTVLLDTYRQILPGSNANASNPEEMLVGDMCNAIMGRFKGFMEQNGTHIQITWPMTATGYPTGLAFGSGRLAMVQKLFEFDDLYVELYLDEFNMSKLKRNVTMRKVNTGDLKFF